VITRAGGRQGDLAARPPAWQRRRRSSRRLPPATTSVAPKVHVLGHCAAGSRGSPAPVGPSRSDFRRHRRPHGAAPPARAAGRHQGGCGSRRRRRNPLWTREPDNPPAAGGESRHLRGRARLCPSIPRVAERPLLTQPPLALRRRQSSMHSATKYLNGHSERPPRAASPSARPDCVLGTASSGAQEQTARSSARSRRGCACSRGLRTLRLAAVRRPASRPGAMGGGEPLFARPPAGAFADVLYPRPHQFPRPRGGEAPDDRAASAACLSIRRPPRGDAGRRSPPPAKTKLWKACGPSLRRRREPDRAPRLASKAPDTPVPRPRTCLAAPFGRPSRTRRRPDRRPSSRRWNRATTVSLGRQRAGDGHGESQLRALRPAA